ncbi:hypothetical protein FG626_21870, partial [Salmonella enterica subsp. enterica serovar Johannesburg]
MNNNDAIFLGSHFISNIKDAHVVSRRDTFAGKISLLFGHYNGVGIYLIDAPHLYERPGSP